MKIAAWILAVLVLGIAGLGAFHDAFNQVTVSEESLGPFQFVYRPVETIDYQQVPKLSHEISDKLDAIGVDSRSHLDVYYPDGSAQIGFRVSDVVLKMSLSDGTLVRTIPEQQYLVAKFPWRSPLSFIVGYMKIDPAFRRYRMSVGYEQTEAMTLLEGKVITYLQPIKPG